MILGGTSDLEMKIVLMSKIIDITGQKFGKLTVIKQVEKPKKFKRKESCWLVRCDCGNEKIILKNSLINGNTRSCGCIRKGLNEKGTVVNDGKKTCSRCLKEQNIDQFCNWRYGRDGLYPQCKTCTAILQKKIRYGLSEKDVKILSDKHNGLCHCCLKEPWTSVDHCHKTGKVRGFLCMSCNVAAGALKDDPERAKNMMFYLIEHQVTIKEDSIDL